MALLAPRIRAEHTFRTNAKSPDEAKHRPGHQFHAATGIRTGTLSSLEIIQDPRGSVPLSPCSKRLHGIPFSRGIPSLSVDPGLN